MPRDLPDFTAMARSLFLEPGKCPHEDANMHGPRYGCPDCMADDLRAAYIAGLRRAAQHLLDTVGERIDVILHDGETMELAGEPSEDFYAGVTNCALRTKARIRIDLTALEDDHD